MILQEKKKKSFKLVKFQELFSAPLHFLCFSATKFGTEVAEYEKADQKGGKIRLFCTMTKKLTALQQSKNMTTNCSSTAN